MSWVDGLFRPRGIAVVGSISPGKIGRVLIDQLHNGGFERVYVVNPKAAGLPNVTAATSVGELVSAGHPIDSVVVASPAATVASVLEDAGQAGVRVAIIITAGFRETGNAEAEKTLLEVASRYGMRLIGPNCAGIVNTKHKLFPTLETRPPAGDVAFISQSGALGGAVLSWAEEQGVGFSKFVSYGNALDVSEIELLDLLREDDESRVVCLYIESVSDGRAFLRAAKDLAAVKPLLVIKSGRSDVGRQATLSHTGSMAGTDAVYDAALRQCGALRVNGIEEMFDLCRGFVSLPPVRGRRLAIVTNSGGPGVLTADEAVRYGLEVVSPSDDLRAQLQEKLPSFCSFGNPIDLTVQGDEAGYRDALIAALGEADAAVAINVNTPYLDAGPMARGVVEAARATGKPVAANFMAGKTVETALPILASGGVANFATGERAVRVLAAQARYARAACASRISTSERTPESAVAQPLPWDRNPLEPEAMDWLEEKGIPVIPRVLARSTEEAVHAARSFEQPVAMKVVSPGILHKTDAGGVILDVSGDGDVAAAFAQLQDVAREAGFAGVLVTPMVRNAVEAIVGLSRDPQFGPVVAFGLGGIHTEVLRDVSFRIAPIRGRDAWSMLDELRSAALLHGVRGGAARDLDALVSLLSTVSQLPFAHPEIEELDLNPVFLLERGLLVGDVRVLRTPADRAGETIEK